MGNVREEIAKNLLYYRKKKGLTQKELAEFLSVNNSAVSNWEKGLNSIDIDTLHRACMALDISVNDMFGAFSNVSNMALTPDEADIVIKLRKLDERGKKAVCDTLDREYQYIEEQQAEQINGKHPHIPDIEQITKGAQAVKKAMDAPVSLKK